jgi:hypothetical protein
MAKVYSSSVPAPEFMGPDGTWDSAGYEDRCNQYRENVKAELISLGYKHKHLGRIIRFGVADGYAQYMVANGTTMIHLEEVDAYSIPAAHARGVRISEEIARQDSMNALFSRASV